MYIVTINNGSTSIPIHNSKEKLTSGKITKGINTIDSFQFAMLPSNIGFNELYDYVTLVNVYNTNKNRYEFYGRVLYSEDAMDESGAITKEVICENYFGFFCDSQQDYRAERNWTVGGLLQHIINTHNSQVESYKQFTLGEVTVTDPNDNIYCGIQRENTWEALKKKLIDVLGGEFRFRVEGDVIYLDYLKEIGEVSSTTITLSKNMKSISREKDPSEIVTRLIPLGCKLKTKDGKDTEERLDISSVNNGKKYIDDETAISIYGIRVATVEFDDVTVASTLLKKGEDWLIANNKISTSYTITALDLSLIGLDTDDFEVCNYYIVKNHLLGIDDTLRIIKKSVDICDETKSTLEFGDNFETLSASMKRQSDVLNLITSNYVTNQKFESTIEKTSTLIEQTEERIKLEVDAQYSDLSQITSELKIEVGQISSTVSETGTQVDELTGRIKSAESNITQLSNEISLKVSQNEVDELTGRIELAETSISLNTHNIETKVSETYGDDTYEFGWKLLSTGFEIYSNASTVLKVDSSGLDVLGKVTAIRGKIGAWNINNNGTLVSATLTSGNTAQGWYHGIGLNPNVNAFTSEEEQTIFAIGNLGFNGDSNPNMWSVAPFRVTNAGRLYATDAVIGSTTNNSTTIISEGMLNVTCNTVIDVSTNAGVMDILYFYINEQKCALRVKCAADDTGRILVHDLYAVRIS